MTALIRFTLPVVIVAVCCLGVLPAFAQSPAPDAPKVKLAANQRVSIDFNDVDIHLFIKFISEITGRNFVVDQRVKGKVTIISPSQISVAEAYRVFTSVLEVHGFTIVDSGEITKIVPMPDARTRNIETRFKKDLKGDDDKVITQIIPLTYGDANEIKKLLTPLVSKSSIILAYAPTNTLIVTDVQSNIKRLLGIINTIDVTGIGHEIALIPLENAVATDTVKILQTVFDDQVKTKKGTGAKQIRMISDDRTNTLITVGNENDTQRVRALATMLDQKIPRSREKVHVRYLEYAKAENIAKVLTDLQGGGGGGGGSAEKGKMPILADQSIKITSDSETNSLIIFCQKDDYLAISEIIDGLDIPRTMVYIESLIMEVDSGKQLEFGTDWRALGDTEISGRDTVFGGGFRGGDERNERLDELIDPDAGPDFPVGASMGIFTEEISIAGLTFRNLQAVINYFREDRETSIISTPQLLTMDNEEAKIVVGRNVPYQTTTSTSNNDTFNSFEYRDVGTTLIITPQISQGDMIRLNISHEISVVESGQLIARPTTLKRVIDTTVLVENQSTIVIGGLIDSQVSVSEWKIPFLGDIPLLGYLFKSEGKQTDRTNLYIFLTPVVVKNRLDAAKLYKEKSDHIYSIRDKIDSRAESVKLYPYPEAEKKPGPSVIDVSPDQEEGKKKPAPRVIFESQNPDR
ncbi:MAG: type II secretion system secretin GspD [Desulfobacterales bacterium]|jgi:general secretion pathway protein D